MLEHWMSEKDEKEIETEVDKFTNRVLWLFLLALIVVASVTGVCRWIFIV